MYKIGIIIVYYVYLVVGGLLEINIGKEFSIVFGVWYYFNIF